MQAWNIALNEINFKIIEIDFNKEYGIRENPISGEEK